MTIKQGKDIHPGQLFLFSKKKLPLVHVSTNNRFVWTDCGTKKSLFSAFSMLWMRLIKGACLHIRIDNVQLLQYHVHCMHAEELTYIFACVHLLAMLPLDDAVHMHTCISILVQCIYAVLHRTVYNRHQ